MSTAGRMPRRRRVVFVDWWGVLSHDFYWQSICADPHHPIREQLMQYIGEILTDNSIRGDEWMRGLRSSQQVIAAMNLTPTAGLDEGFLLDTLIRDCAAMSVNTELAALLAEIREQAFIVVATDNIDCFADTFRRAQRAAAPWFGAAATLTNAVGLFDDLICSSDVGVCKKDDPNRFFGGWLDAHGLTIAEATLIDDKTTNCDAFDLHGGTAVRWDANRDSIAELRHTLEQWTAHSLK
ncbi:hypothetical protein AB0J47_18410 [Nocardia sp. NPDC049737]|uniref:hypothetical protein n=1 Tax=Nocardia sp. NPDC049737 TaxID=3154358 RepID=UPI00344331B1